jgi:3-oxoacyl-[acyl-carrier protein] reductase
MNAQPRALVTGGASGIGAATTAVLRERGWTVFIADVIRGIGVHPLEVTDEAGWMGIVDELWPLDGLVNCAGIRDRSALADMTVDQFDRMLAIHLRGGFLGAREAARRWRLDGRPGSIVNVASVNATHAIANQAHYVAAKAGLAGLTRALAVELAPDGIRVNAVAPGFTRTPMTEQRFTDPGQLEWHHARIPMARHGEPREIAAAIGFLLGEDASYVTGALLPVDGGWAAC